MPPVARGKTKGDAGALLNEARAFLGSAATQESYLKEIDRTTATRLQDQAKSFYNEFQNQPRGRVRIIHCWPLFLVEEGLALHIGLKCDPSDGYKLAADWAKNFDATHGDGLNGSSRGKLQELVRFMFAIEAVEDNP